MTPGTRRIESSRGFAERMMSGGIETRIFKGTRDFLPADMAVRNRAISILRETFESFGFEPIETPAFEFMDVLTGKSGGEEDKLIFPLAYRDGRTLGLRYDLTVPLSRVMAMHGKNLPMPFKRYQIQPVWRADNPQAGRFREFCQCDIDIIGSPEMSADAEILLIVRSAMKKLGFAEFCVEVNNRKIITGLMEAFGVPPESRVAACKAVDKLEKMGPGAVGEILVSRDGGPGMAEAAAGGLLDALVTTGDPADDMRRVEAAVGNSAAGKEGFGELRRIYALAEAATGEPGWLRFSPGMVRGLDYYTGPIFEIKVTEPKIGSLGGGGRYDRLVGQLGGGEGYPAVGLAFGLERIIIALAEKKDAAASPAADVLVTVFSDDLAPQSLRLADAMRKAGLRAETYVGEAGKLAKQFKHAAKKNIPITAVVGPDEIAAGQVKIKDMRSGVQESVASVDAPSRISALVKPVHRGPGRISGEFAELLRRRLEKPEEKEKIDAQIRERFETDAAVMMTDSVGFTRITASKGIIHSLSILQMHAELLRPVIERHRGELLKQDVDNLFAVFPSAKQAVDAAIAMNAALDGYNAVAEPDSTIQICTGIGFGRITRIEGDAFGDQVNKASKLGEDVASGKEILLTREAYDQVRGAGFMFDTDTVEPAKGVVLEFYRLMYL